MARAASSIQPLHFEDLEPHRFEDLVRQLIYDFRPWTALEATGRSGSDDGFDVRGRETGGVFVPSTEVSEDGDEHEEPEGATAEERIWLIQCKRERRIGPKKLESYAEDVLSKAGEPVYGCIFSAPCDFSKQARDRFIAKIREHGVSEFRLWGKAEIEDMLFQPVNDHLLFAHFGVSLQVRQRSQKTRIRSIIATKRKLVRLFGSPSLPAMAQVLVRDPNEDRYPWTQDVPNWDKEPTWRPYRLIGHYHAGLIFQTAEWAAYIGDDRVHFDYAAAYNDARVHNDPWSPERRHESAQLRSEIHAFWLTIPQNNRARLMTESRMPYENIIAIDEDGDDHYPAPHIYVPFIKGSGPFTESLSEMVLDESGADPVYPGDDDNRIVHFPAQFRSKD